MSGVVATVVQPINSQASATSTLTPHTVAYDYAIGGFGFLSAIGTSVSAYSKLRYERATAPYRKDQQDQSSEPGEQSLVYWWLRSQSSFHGGAGRVFAEPTDSSDQDASIQFESSLGLNVWTPGSVTLLNATSVAKSATGSCFAVGATDGTTPVFFQAEGSTLTRGDGTTNTPVTWGGGGTIRSVCSDGSNYYAADATGIYKGTLAGGAGAKVYDTGAVPLIAWAKQRLMAAVGPSIYELSAAGPGLPVAKFTHPNSAWVWTAFAEGPQAIYAAGYAGEQSAVFKFVLDANGGVPTVTTGMVCAKLPTGEQIRSLYVYLDKLVLFGTSKGVRVGTLSGSDMTWGPLSITTTNPVLGLVGLGDFVYATATNELSGNSGLFRLDLGRLLSSGRYAYATDLQAHTTGTVQSVTLLGNKLLFTVDGHGSYLEGSTPEASGSLTTGRIRYHTIEPKLFKFLKIRTAALSGSIGATVTDPSGSSTSVVTFVGTGQTDLEEAALSAGPLEFMQLTFTLTPAGSVSPIFRGYQLKSLPAQKRQRQESIPLLCFDFEKSRSGGRVGSAGYALSRLEALEALEEAGDIVLLQHLTADPLGVSSRLVVIDEVKFTQTSPPTQANGWGGVLEVLVRSVT